MNEAGESNCFIWGIGYAIDYAFVSGAAAFVDIQVGLATHVRYETIVSLRQTNKAATTATVLFHFQIWARRGLIPAQRHTSKLLQSRNTANVFLRYHTRLQL